MIFPLHKTMWFDEVIPGDYCQELHYWACKEEDWVVIRCNWANVFIDAETLSIIICLPHVQDCPGLGHCLSMQELHWLRAEHFDGDPNPECDVRVPQADKTGDNFLVMAYSQVSTLPTTPSMTPTKIYLCSTPGSLKYLSSGLTTKAV